MRAEDFRVDTADGARLAATRWRGDGPTVLLLHAGVADRRSWTDVGERLGAAGFDVVAYDRRGFGETPAAAPTTQFSHAGDLVRILDALTLDRAFLVGNSMGGALALDVALLHPDRVTTVLLIGAAVSGMTDEDTPFEWHLDDATAPLLERAEDTTLGQEERIDALAHLWLDGPTSQERRVGGAARDRFVAMNRTILEVGAPDSAGDAGVDAWARLSEVRVPVLTTWGALDVPCDIPFYEETARRIGQRPGRVLPGVAHLPGLEDPDMVARLIADEGSSGH